MVDNNKLREIASQLRKPEGTKGIFMANMMNETNINMTIHSIEKLDLSNDDRILELGHANCGHLAYLLSLKKNLSYCGLEISELMVDESKRINCEFIDNDQASFYYYDGNIIPFPDLSFNKIFTVNTIYFWENPTAFLLELYRILKPNGILSITFMDESYLERMPFSRFYFNLYNKAKFSSIIQSTSFKILDICFGKDFVENKSDEAVERDFLTFKLGKEEG